MYYSIEYHIIIFIFILSYSLHLKEHWPKILTYKSSKPPACFTKLNTSELIPGEQIHMVSRPTMVKICAGPV